MRRAFQLLGTWFKQLNNILKISFFADDKSFNFNKCLAWNGKISCWTVKIDQKLPNVNFIFFNSKSTRNRKIIGSQSNASDYTALETV